MLCSWAQEGEKGNLTIITVVVVFIDAVTVGSIELLLRHSPNTLHKGPCQNFTYNGRAYPASFTHLVLPWSVRTKLQHYTEQERRGDGRRPRGESVDGGGNKCAPAGLSVANHEVSRKRQLCV